MKKHSLEVQYTARGVPPDADRSLRRKAASQGRSLNQVIVDELTAATVGSRKKADFSDLVGKWRPDRAFDEVLAGQRQIDTDKWK